MPAEPAAMLRAATQGAPRRASEGRLCGPQMHGKYSAAVSEGLVDVYSELSRAIADKCHVSKIAPREGKRTGQTNSNHTSVGL